MRCCIEPIIFIYDVFIVIIFYNTFIFMLSQLCYLFMDLIHLLDLFITYII